MERTKATNKKLTLAGKEIEQFRIAIVGQDPINSALLVDAMARSLDCDAMSAAPSDLMDILGNDDIVLVVINANLGSDLGAGYVLAETVSSAHPKIPIVLLLDQPSSESTIMALSCGARGLFNRQQSITDLIDCIEHVRKGAIWAGPEETAFLLDAFRRLPGLRVRPGLDRFALTVRELQVVRHAAFGKTNREIANELLLSEHTVKNYIFRAFEKLGVSSRVELLFYLSMHDRTDCAPSNSEGVSPLGKGPHSERPQGAARRQRRSESSSNHN